MGVNRVRTYLIQLTVPFKLSSLNAFEIDCKEAILHIKIMLESVPVINQY